MSSLLFRSSVFASRAIVSSNGTFVQTRNMAALKDIKIRMKSVASVQKITNSMKTVAASKLKAAEVRKERVKPFQTAALEAISSVMNKQPLTPEVNALVIPMTSDRGLCGGINSTIGRAFKELVKQKKLGNYRLLLVGDKARQILTREFGDLVTHTVNDLDVRPLNFYNASAIAELVMKQNYDLLSVFCNKFISVLAFETQRKDIISLKTLLASKELIPYEFEGTNQEILENYYSFYLASFFYTALIENAACELGQRMASMDNATRNAGDMLKSLTLQYNRKRQASITTQLIEIISGAAGVEEQG